MGEIELRVKCECGQELGVRLSNLEIGVVIAKSCPKCIEEAAQDGYEEGQQDA